VRSNKIKNYIKENTDIDIDKATNAYSRDLVEFNKLKVFAKEN